MDSMDSMDSGLPPLIGLRCSSSTARMMLRHIANPKREGAVLFEVAFV